MFSFVRDFMVLLDVSHPVTEFNQHCMFSFCMWYMGTAVFPLRWLNSISISCSHFVCWYMGTAVFSRRWLNSSNTACSRFVCGYMGTAVFSRRWLNSINTAFSHFVCGYMGTTVFPVWWLNSIHCISSWKFWKYRKKTEGMSTKIKKIRIISQHDNCMTKYFLPFVFVL